MIKKLSACLLSSGLLFSGLTLASEGDNRSGSSCNPNDPSKWINQSQDEDKAFDELTDGYVSLMEQYQAVAESDLPQSVKAQKLWNISEEMRFLGIDGIYLNKDYNDCMRESNKQQRSDYDRCDRNGGGDKCYDRADRNNDDRRAACERVAHSDNTSRTVSDTKKRDRR